MSHDLTQINKHLTQRKRLDLPTFPVHRVNPDGSLAELTDAQWRSVAVNVERLEAVRHVGQEAMFQLADLMANERERFGDDDRGFGAHLKAHGVKVERNELSVMGNWWRHRTQDQRDECVLYAATHGINRMVTLKRHFLHLEHKGKTIDVDARPVDGDGQTLLPAKRESKGSRLLSGLTTPGGVTSRQLESVMEALAATPGMTPAGAAGVVFLLARSNPAWVLERADDMGEEAADALRRALR